MQQSPSSSTDVAAAVERLVQLYEQLTPGHLHRLDSYYASDARFKRNIQEDVHGIDLIMKLRPVTYNFDAHKMAAFLKEDMRYDQNGNAVLQPPHPDMVAARDQKAAIRFTGFLAQEVEKAADELGYDFSAVVKPVDENDMYALRYSEFVVPLVKGMQEQQALIESQQAMIEQLQERIVRLEQGR